MNVVAFLEARIAEDEADAKAANPAPWFYNGYSAILSQPMLKPHDEWENTAFADGHSLEKRRDCKACGKDYCELHATDYQMDPLIVSIPAQYGDTATGRRVGDGQHIERHNPARVLAECAAKRAIIDEYTGSPATFQIIAHMAAVYRDHPDYRQEWTP